MLSPTSCGWLSRVRATKAGKSHTFSGDFFGSSFSWRSARAGVGTCPRRPVEAGQMWGRRQRRDTWPRRRRGRPDVAGTRQPLTAGTAARAAPAVGATPATGGAGGDGGDSTGGSRGAGGDGGNAHSPVSRQGGNGGDVSTGTGGDDGAGHSAVNGTGGAFGAGGSGGSTSVTTGRPVGLGPGRRGRRSRSTLWRGHGGLWRHSTRARRRHRSRRPRIAYWRFRRWSTPWHRPPGTHFCGSRWSSSAG